MNSTASPRPSVALGQATKFIRVLENGGVTAADIQRVIDDHDFRIRVLEAFGYKVELGDFDLPGDFRQDGVDRLVNRMYDKFVRNVKPKSYRPLIGPKPGPEKYLERYRSTDTVKQMLADLSPFQLNLVVLTFGLVGGVAHNETEVAQLLEITTWRAKQNLGRALGVMSNSFCWISNDEREANFEATRPTLIGPLLLETPIWYLPMDTRSYEFLERSGIHVVADLIRLSPSNLHFLVSKNSVDKIEAMLEEYSFKLNR